MNHVRLKESWYYPCICCPPSLAPHHPPGHLLHRGPLGWVVRQTEVIVSEWVWAVTDGWVVEIPTQTPAAALDMD